MLLDIWICDLLCYCLGRVCCCFLLSDLACWIDKEGVEQLWRLRCVRRVRKKISQEYKAWKEGAQERKEKWL